MLIAFGAPPTAFPMRTLQQVSAIDARSDYSLLRGASKRRTRYSIDVLSLTYTPLFMRFWSLSNTPTVFCRRSPPPPPSPLSSAREILVGEKSAVRVGPGLAFNRCSSRTTSPARGHHPVGGLGRSNVGGQRRDGGRGRGSWRRRGAGEGKRRCWKDDGSELG